MLGDLFIYFLWFTLHSRDFRARRTPKVFVFLCNALFMSAFCRIRTGRVSICTYIHVFATHDHIPCVAEGSAPL